MLSCFDVDNLRTHRQLAEAIRAAAMAYVVAGISVIPIRSDGSKRPASYILPEVLDETGTQLRRPWKPFQQHLPAPELLEYWFSTDPQMPLHGIAAVCGQVSGGLELLDFDELASFGPWEAAMRLQAPALLERLVMVESPRPGRHIYFRSSMPQGNQILASKRICDKSDVPGKFKVVIETRGEGGYALVPPSPPECHPTMRPYRYMRTQTLIDVPIVTSEERQLMFELARRQNESPQSMPRGTVSNRPEKENTNSISRSPLIDDFNRRMDWRILLEPHGWVLVRVDTNDVGYWRRPGKTSEFSATTNHGGLDLMTCFTSNAPPR
jgi:hypothetical protein